MKKLLIALILILIASPLVMAQADDPCALKAQKIAVINQAATGPLTVIAKATGKHTYLCHITFSNTTAQTANLIESANANCGTPTSGLLGGTTAATGLSLGTAGSIDIGDGSRTVARTATAGDNVCLITSGTTQISGVISYVQK